MSKTKLNIFLGKPGITYEDAKRHHGDYAPECLELPEGGKFYYKEAAPNIPKWVDPFFLTALDNIKEDLCNKTVQAAYITEVQVADNETRLFAITFGLGRNLLNLDKFEERFGIITAMNLIDTQRLRSVDYNTIAENPKARRIQLGKTSTLSEFELDDEYDLVKNMSGKVTDNAFADATSASGRQSLSLSITSDYLSIAQLLKQLYHIYQDQAYIEKFPGISQTREVKDKTEIARLDNLVVGKLNDMQQNPEITVGLAIPVIDIKDSEISEFFYADSRNPFDELDINDMVTELANLYPQGIELDTLKNKYLSIQDDNHARTGSWKIYRCLFADCRMDNHQYVLNDGKWYEYNEDYAAQVDTFYNNAEICPIQMPDCPIKKKNKPYSEGEYNKDAQSALPDSVLWDCALINPFKQTPFEVCDIFDKNSNSFIHVKKNTGSSALSHLFFQGFVSGNVMNASKTRESVLAKKPEMQGCVEIGNYNASNYNIVYAIIETNNKNGDRPQIPFFSKVSFRQVAHTLQNFGYKVQLKSINWV